MRNSDGILWIMQVEKMKILYVATVRGHIGRFHLPVIRRLNELGCTVDGAFRDNSKEVQIPDMSALHREFDIPFSRSPYSRSNIKAYKALKKVISENDYDAVHCHTPMGSVVARLAVKNLKKDIKVIYTAHGFHFYKGAPKKNWSVYYPVEKRLAKYTDCLVTINNEDYELAKKSLKAGMIRKVDGVGVDTARFSFVDSEKKRALRKECGYAQDDFIMIYPAEISKRKNQMMLLRALRIVKDKHPNVRLLLPGLQTDIAECRQYVDANQLGENVQFLGYRRDIPQLVGMSDISVSSSRQEGLPVNVIEAMAMGNPIIATDVRGNNDLVREGVNGYLVGLNDSEAMAEKINYLIEHPDAVETLGRASCKMSETYSMENAVREMEEIYRELKLL